ncbi:serine/arginine repetitive matrix protein 3-like [Ochotona princeps]|uniref:serine/arginine repetitive matrix protein 3-like n=1 Tax=Ochotona princeps TaxID=9978 RepID=UPI002714F4E8|nr:serine/arginine repetitive matrix protein 3-like [Ochotona princeps]
MLPRAPRRCAAVGPGRAGPGRAGAAGGGGGRGRRRGRRTGRGRRPPARSRLRVRTMPRALEAAPEPPGRGAQGASVRGPGRARDTKGKGRAGAAGGEPRPHRRDPRPPSGLYVSAPGGAASARRPGPRCRSGKAGRLEGGPAGGPPRGDQASRGPLPGRKWAVVPAGERRAGLQFSMYQSAGIRRSPPRTQLAWPVSPIMPSSVLALQEQYGKASRAGMSI